MSDQRHLGRDPNTPPSEGQYTLAEVETLAREAHRKGHVIALVEGVSDQQALCRLIDRIGAARANPPPALVPVPTSGAGNLRRFAALLGPRGLSAKFAVLCDAGEEPHVRRALADSGFGPDTATPGWLGIFVCREDLEDELIRALGPDKVLAIAEERGELRSFRKLQTQPEWRSQPLERQLRRWMGVSARRKITYSSPLLVDAVPLDSMPAPLAELVAITEDLVRHVRRQKRND